MKNRLNLSVIFYLLFLVCTTQQLWAQVRAISSPNFVNNFGTLSSVCSDPDDIFTVVSVLAPGDPLPFNNQFILELSDESGNFTDTIELDRVDGPNNGTTVDSEIRFENVIIPENTNSESYSIRVRSSETTNISPPSASIPIHFYRDDLSLRINNTQDLILCNVVNFSRSLSITITDIDDGSSVDPEIYEYQWFRGAFPGGSLISGEIGSSLVVTQDDLDASGQAQFYAQVNLGSCNSQFPSARTNTNTVRLIEVSTVNILEAPNVNYCPQDANKILNSSVTDFRNTYQWFKDGTAIEGAIAPSYDLPDNNFGGDYTLQVTYSEDCTVTTLPVLVINDGSSITQTLIEDLIILPTEIISLEIITDAPLAPTTNSRYQWFRDTSPQTGQLPLTTADVSFDVSNQGTYRVNIIADDTCMSMLFSESNIYSPVGIDLVITNSNLSLCEDNMFTLEIENIFGLTQPGSGAPSQVPLIENQYDFFDFEWFRNGVSTGITTRTIDIDGSDEDAVYTLVANLRTGEFTNIISNELELITIPEGIAIEASSETIPTNGSITLSVPNNSSYTYQWFTFENDVETTIDGANTNTLVVNQENTYFVRISSNVCSLDTPMIQIGNDPGFSTIIPNIITINGDGINDIWILPDEFRNQLDVQVTIYNAQGKIDFEGTNYQNDWPRENSRSSGEDSIYYYIIARNNTVVRKGSITVMR